MPLSILETLASSISPSLVAAAGKAIGADPALVQRAVDVGGPLLLGSVAKAAATPAGAAALMQRLPQDSGSLLDSLGGSIQLMSGLASGGRDGSLLQSLLGPGTNAVGAALSKALGFNVTPVLGLLAPALVGSIGKLVKEQGLDAGSIGGVLSQQVTQFEAQPANRATLDLISTAQDAGRRATATIESFGADWDQVLVGPAAALYLVTSSDISGPVGAIAEVKAANAALLEAARAASPDSLIAAAFAGGFTTTMLEEIREGARNKASMLERLKASLALVQARAPQQAGAYKAVLQAVGKAAAEGAKEGGFLGIGGTLVSADEKRALEQIEAAIAA
jgi:hypothetical protein